MNGRAPRHAQAVRHGNDAEVVGCAFFFRHDRGGAPVDHGIGERRKNQPRTVGQACAFWVNEGRDVFFPGAALAPRCCRSIGLPLMVGTSSPTGTAGYLPRRQSCRSCNGNSQVNGHCTRSRRPAPNQGRGRGRQVYRRRPTGRASPKAAASSSAERVTTSLTI